MMFCKENVGLVMMMIRALKVFYVALGLYTNKEKYAVYFGNVNDVQQRIRQLFRFIKRE